MNSRLTIQKRLILPVLLLGIVAFCQMYYQYLILIM